MPDHSISPSMTAPVVPACMAVIERRGDRLIRIRLPQTGFDAVVGWVGSAVFLSAPFGMILSIFFKPGEGSYYPFVLLAVFAVFWWRYCSRRPRLTIDTAKGRYSLVWHLSGSYWKGLPQFTVVRELQGGAVTSRLMIGTVLVAEHKASPGHADESIFDGFIAKFGRPPTPQSPVISNHLSDDVELPAASVIVHTAPPLILLVHGTCGAKSPWTFPGSFLREAISKHFCGAVEIDRHPWSGQNSPKARRAGSVALKDRLQEIFNKTPRKVVLICHSHGGNVALLARELLAAEYQQSVWVITMATPFLRQGRRFVTASTLQEIPEERLSIIAGGLGAALLLGIGLLLILLGFAVATIADWLALLLKVSPTVLAWLLYPAALALLVYGCRKLVSWVHTLPASATTTLSRFDRQSLAISYSQDEAFEAISIVVNLISLVYLAVFIGGRAIIRLVARWEPFEWISFIAYMAVLLAVATLAFSMAGSAIIDAVIPRSSQPEWLATLLSEMTRLAPIVVDKASLWVFSSLAFWAVVFAFAVAVIGLMALARFTLFYLIGVADLARSQEELLALIVGSLSVSMVPEGGAESYQITGSARFNHTAIYDDERTIACILRYLKQVIDDDGASSEAISTLRGGV
jgi:hypothetical protein